MLHINLFILYILFIKLNFDLKEFQVSNNYFKSYQDNKMKFWDELFLIYIEFEYQLDECN